MLPPFDDNGYLPPGIHPATLDEIATRFGSESELRQAQMDSLRWLADAAWRAGALRLIVNGSFTTDKYEPNDVDCVILIGVDYPRNADAHKEIHAGLPFMSVKITDDEEFLEYTEFTYASDRKMIPKGMVEVNRHD